MRVVDLWHIQLSGSCFKELGNWFGLGVREVGEGHDKYALTHAAGKACSRSAMHRRWGVQCFLRKLFILWKCCCGGDFLFLFSSGVVTYSSQGWPWTPWWQSSCFSLLSVSFLNLHRSRISCAFSFLAVEKFWLVLTFPSFVYRALADECKPCYFIGLSHTYIPTYLL